MANFKNFILTLTLISCHPTQAVNDSNTESLGSVNVLSRSWQPPFKSRNEIAGIAKRLAERTRIPGPGSKQERFRTAVFAVIEEGGGIAPQQTAEIVTTVVTGDKSLCQIAACSDLTGVVPAEVGNFLAESAENTLLRQPPSAAKKFLLSNSLSDKKPLDKIIVALEAETGRRDLYNMTVGEAYHQLSRENLERTLNTITKSGPLTPQEKQIMEIIEQNMSVYIYHATGNVSERAEAILESKALLSPKEGNLQGRDQTNLQEPEDELFSSSEYVFFRMSAAPIDREWTRTFGTTVFQLKNDTKSLENMTKIGVWGAPMAGNTFLQQRGNLSMPVGFMGAPPDPKEVAEAQSKFLRLARSRKEQAEYARTVITPSDFKHHIAMQFIKNLRENSNLNKEPVVDHFVKVIAKTPDPVERSKMVELSIRQNLRNSKCAFNGYLELHFPRRAPFHWLDSILIHKYNFIKVAPKLYDKVPEEYKNLVRFYDAYGK
jgi:hypothetical protein